MGEAAATRRGRPRDEAVDQRVLSAAWGLLHAGGYAALNVDDVAERAGVAKTTLYRRWPTKDHLAIAAAAQVLGEVPIPDSGDLRRDLAEFAGPWPRASTGCAWRVTTAAGRRRAWPPSWSPRPPATPTSAR